MSVSENVVKRSFVKLNWRTHLTVVSGFVFKVKIRYPFALITFLIVQMQPIWNHLALER